DHLARGLGVERLVRVADGRAAETGQERHAAEEQQEQGRTPRNLTIVYWGVEGTDAERPLQAPGRRHRRLRGPPQVRQPGRPRLSAAGTRSVPDQSPRA